MLVAYEGYEQQSVKVYHCCLLLRRSGPIPLVLGFLTSEIGVLHALE